MSRSRSFLSLDPLPHGRGFHEKVCLCQAENTAPVPPDLHRRPTEGARIPSLSFKGRVLAFLPLSWLVPPELARGLRLGSHRPPPAGSPASIRTHWALLRPGASWGPYSQRVLPSQFRRSTSASLAECFHLPRPRSHPNPVSADRPVSCTHSDRLARRLRKGLVVPPALPQRQKQYRQFPGHCDDCSLLRRRAAAGHQLQPPGA